MLEFWAHQDKVDRLDFTDKTCTAIGDVTLVRPNGLTPPTGHRFPLRGLDLPGRAEISLIRMMYSPCFRVRAV